MYAKHPLCLNRYRDSYQSTVHISPGFKDSDTPTSICHSSRRKQSCVSTVVIDVDVVLCTYSAAIGGMMMPFGDTRALGHLG